jgi:adenosylcobinamide-GDP ribazoletransferase
VQFIRHLLLAIQFFTRIPVHGRLGAWVGFSPAMLRASAAHFPGVGWIVAAVAGAVFAGLLMGLPGTHASPWVAAIACTVASVWLTGGFHEDGLADTADGLGGHVSRERALEIMKDSRIGAYGAMALVLALLMKISLLALLGEVDPPMALTALVCAHVFSRFLPLVLIRVLPHVGDAARLEEQAPGGPNQHFRIGNSHALVHARRRAEPVGGARLDSLGGLAGRRGGRPLDDSDFGRAPAGLHG